LSLQGNLTFCSRTEEGYYSKQVLLLFFNLNGYTTKVTAKAKAQRYRSSDSSAIDNYYIFHWYDKDIPIYITNMTIAYC